MVRENKKLSTVPKKMKDKLKSMYFATFLLGEDGPHPEFVTVISAIWPWLKPFSRAHRLQTPLLLIDFDVAENDDPDKDLNPTSRTVRVVGLRVWSTL
jgi:hypothetical protein